MSTGALPAPPSSRRPAAVPDDLIWRMSRDQYHEMIRAGILTDDDPVEMLEGWLIHKMPKSPLHRIVTRLMQKALEGAVPEGWYVDAQEPITLEDSEPEPDVVIVRGDTRHYLDHHPAPQDVDLVVEVSDTTLQRDRGLKKRLYARAGIPAYWIIILPENRLEVCTDPSGPAEEPDYRHCRTVGLSDTVPLAIEGQEVVLLDVREFFP